MRINEWVRLFSCVYTYMSFYELYDRREGRKKKVQRERGEQMIAPFLARFSLSLTFLASKLA